MRWICSASVGLLDATDVELVVAYAMTVEIRDTSYQQLEKTGLLVESDRGNISPNPAEKMHADGVPETQGSRGPRWGLRLGVRR